MATVKLTPSQKNMLESMANGALLIPHSYNKMVVMSLVKKNLIQATKTYSVGSDYELTDAGRAVLGIEPLPPMVDQTQPAPEVEPLKVKQLTDSRKRALKWINTRIVKHGECHIYVAQKHGLKLTTLNKLMDLGFIEYDGHKIVLTDAALPYLE